MNKTQLLPMTVPWSNQGSGVNKNWVRVSLSGCYWTIVLLYLDKDCLQALIIWELVYVTPDTYTIYMIHDTIYDAHAWHVYIRYMIWLLDPQYN